MMIASLLLTLTSVAWTTPTTPSASAQAELLDAFRSAISAYEAYDRARLNEDRARLTASQTNELLDLVDHENAERALRAARESAFNLFQDALSRTETAYSVGLDRNSVRTIHGGSFDGNKASWRPRVELDRDQPLRLLDPHDTEGTYRYLRPDWKLNDFATTMEDGSVIIRLDFIQKALAARNPGLVAAVLHHEAAHMRQLTENGWASTEETELIAYSESLRDAAAFELGKGELSGKETLTVAMLESKKWENSRAVRRHLHNGERLNSPYVSPEQERRYEDEWIASVKGVIDERDRLRDSLASQRRNLRDARAGEVRGMRSLGMDCLDDHDPASCGRRSSARPLPRRDPSFGVGPEPARPKGRAEKPVEPSRPTRLPELARLAREACAAPGSIPQDRLDAEFYWVANWEYREEAAAGLAGCVRALFLELMELNSTERPNAGIKALWLDRRAAELQDRPAMRPPAPTDASRPTPRERFWSPELGKWVEEVRPR